MKHVRLLGIYAISPIHYGTGQTVGAVDLPVARESHTDLPFLPATGLKGVARDVVTLAVKDREGKGKAEEWEKGIVEKLFGSEPPQPGGRGEQEERARAGEKGSKDGGKKPALEAANLLFTDARLLLLPVRSLQRTFLYVTCPLALLRLERELRAYMRAYEVESFLPERWECPRPEPAGEVGEGGDGKTSQALVGDPALDRKALVLEDLCYDGERVAHQAGIEALGQSLVQLLPEGEALGQQHIQKNIVVVPDDDFRDLAQRTLRVLARTQLTPGKTTDKWKDDKGREYKGNLWYEEALPPDSLLYAFVGAPVLDRSWPENPENLSPSGYLVKKHAFDLQRVQIGGNETVGAGQCWWRFWTSKPKEGQGDVK